MKPLVVWANCMRATRGSAWVRRWLYASVIGICLAVTGCATGPTANPADPLEPLNRGVSSFNDGLDRAILKPVATAYVAITPSIARAGVSNFFGNLQDAWTFVNSVLQLRPQKAAESFMRFMVNTGLGFGGLFDIASEAGIEKHNEDLGKTLGRWGVPAGPYIVLPLFGPSTLRDALTITAEAKFDPVGQIDPVRVRNSATTLRLVNTRAKYLRLGNMLDDAALDKYSFTRDAFLAKRNADVARSANNGVDVDSDPDPTDKSKEDKDDKVDKPEEEGKKAP
jgi:phospholipid-binding lipoprotein MlaA